jgi:lysophospholipase L1-like esterase
MRRIALAVFWLRLALAGVAHAGEPMTVMPLGDSITAGTVPGGYRGPMVERLARQYGLAVTTVGTQSDASLPAGQRAHEGHGGWRIDQLADNLLGVVAVDAGAHGGHWLDGGHSTGRGPVYPQFVTVMAGINDINQMIGKDPAHPMSDRSDAILATVEDRLTRLVTTLTAERPAATVLLGGCIPYDNGLLNDKLTGADPAHRAAWARADGVSEKQEMGVNHWVIGFNRWMRQTYVPRMRAAGKRVDYVDLYADFVLPDGSVRGWDNKPPQSTDGPAGYGDFGLHPNAFGYRLIGHTLADAIHAHQPVGR